ncbi:MAG TPA: hypothetical protein DIT05_11335 [Morganella sp. (in: Bacteria)]|nr:hypothetical protein [Morganella sp. (in: enterobacteria)]
MNNEKGCEFCRRYGLPVLPVRPAIMQKGDCLPVLSNDITVPVAADGGAEYTIRLMRRGYLYILAERSQHWINYYVTGDGYFYPLPEDGSVPPRVESGEIKPCITRPAELATASLVTLPVNPAGMTNGIFWFAWSEEMWTPAVRRRYEEAAWRSRYMQKFDMDAWLISHHAQQALPFSRLSSCVAEYSPRLRSSGLKNWTPSPLKTINSHSAGDLQQAADALNAGKGAILVLADPVGVATEISALVHYRMQQDIAADPVLSRGIELQTMLGSIELSIRNYFYLSAETSDEKFEQQIRYGRDTPSGPVFPNPDVADRMHVLNEFNRANLVDEWWQSGYEKYIDRSKADAFSEMLKEWLTEYDNSTVIPATRMYLAWLEAPVMADYFVQHFDPDCAHSGGRYIQTVAKVLEGMGDKGGVVSFIDRQLYQEPLSRENFLLRAAFFNHDAWIAQVDAEAKTGGPDWWLNMSWDRLADGAKEFSSHFASAILVGLEKLSLLWSAAMMKSVDLMVKGTPVRFAVAILAMQGKAFSVVTVASGTKNYIRAMTTGMAGMLEMSSKSGGQLYNAMKRLADRLVENLSENTSQRTQLPRIIDVQATKALSALPVKQRLAKLGTVIVREDDMVRMLFPKSTGSAVAQLEGMSAAQVSTAMATKGIRFGGTVFSVYFQWMVLHYGLEKSGLPAGGKAQAQFAANVSMAVASTAEALKMAMTPLMALELPPVASAIRNGVMNIVRSRIWGALGYAGGMVYAGIEMVDGGVYLFDGKLSIGIAHLINGLGVGMMTFGGGSRISLAILLRFSLSEALLSSSQLAAFFLGPWGIFVGMLLALGAGAWLLSHTRNDIQTWLLSTQWRQVPPGEDNIPAIWPNQRMEKDSYMSLTTQGGSHDESF